MAGDLFLHEKERHPVRRSKRTDTGKDAMAGGLFRRAFLIGTRRNFCTVRIQRNSAKALGGTQRDGKTAIRAHKPHALAAPHHLAVGMLVIVLSKVSARAGSLW